MHKHTSVTRCYKRQYVYKFVFSLQCLTLMRLAINVKNVIENYSLNVRDFEIKTRNNTVTTWL